MVHAWRPSGTEVFPALPGTEGDTTCILRKKCCDFFKLEAFILSTRRPPGQLSLTRLSVPCGRIRAVSVTAVHFLQHCHNTFSRAALQKKFQKDKLPSGNAS